MALDRFNLAWNDFDKCVSNSFKELLDNGYFVDVTLATDDDYHIKAHKVVLSTCSPVLRSILEKHPHQHPLIYMSGIKYQELRSIINFMYIGETEVTHDKLEIFMSIAAKFKIKGLSNCQINEEPSQPKQDGVKLEFKSIHENDATKEPLEADDKDQNNDTQELSLEEDEKENIVKASDDRVMDAHIETNQLTKKESKEPTKIGQEYFCQYCDYKARFRNNVYNHTAAQHEGKRFPCDFCQYESKYYGDLIKHKGRKHLFNKYTSKRALKQQKKTQD